VSESLHFGEFELSAARFELRRHGERVHVQPKVLRLLLHLAEHRSRAVSRSELLSAVWPGETVTLASVKRAVQGARRVLGDGGEHRASIRTVGGHGYQFVLLATEPEAPKAPGRNAFVGREDVLDVLDESLTDLAAGQGRLVLLVGGPGLGKTRTLEELAQRAVQKGVEAWLGRCLEAEGAPPFWPWLQVVRDCIRLRGEQQTRALMGTEAAEILEAVADRDSLLRGVPAAPAIEGARARFRLFDGMTTFLKRSAERWPMALLFDDLHRADQATLHMLLFVARHVFGSRLLVFGTLRRQQESQTTAALLDALTREDPARCLELQGFDHEATSRYVETSPACAPPAPWSMRFTNAPRATLCSCGNCCSARSHRRATGSSRAGIGW
jgi:DNA-binding winged helix-turn-helix (wHTH) protein